MKSEHSTTGYVLIGLEGAHTPFLFPGHIFNMTFSLTLKNKIRQVVLQSSHLPLSCCHQEILPPNSQVTLASGRQHFSISSQLPSPESVSTHSGAHSMPCRFKVSISSIPRDVYLYISEPQSCSGRNSSFSEGFQP